MDTSRQLQERGGLLDNPVLKGRADGIDMLRAVLALWVMLAHALPWALFVRGGKDNLVGAFLSALTTLFQPRSETHPAVIAFIVLSGYCIHRNGFRRGATPRDLRSFAIRRFFRIWPVYALATLVGIACYRISDLAAHRATVAITGVPKLTVKGLLVKLSGISALFPSLHFLGFEGNGPLATVMVEMYLYALYAIVVFLVLNRGFEKEFWSLLLAAYLGGALWVSLHPSATSWWHNGSLLGFSLYWWIGAACVGAGFSRRISTLALPLGIGWFIATLLLFTPAIPIPVKGIVVEARMILFALLFALLITKLDGSSICSPRLLSGLGKAGYSLYAFHAPILIVLLITGRSWWLACLCALAVSLGVYFLYERPLLRLGRHLSA